MLLRTSSAPVLSALNTTFCQAEVYKDFVEPSHNGHCSNLSSLHALPSPHTLHGRASPGICTGEDVHTGLASDQEFGNFARTPRLSRAQSEGDLACFSVTVTAAASYGDHGMPGYEGDLVAERPRRTSSYAAASAFKLKESILEEAEEPDESAPLPLRSRSLLEINGLSSPASNVRNFVLTDGEVYSDVKFNTSGSPVACNDKGCRPLTEVECKQLGLLDFASGIGSGNFGWTSGNRGNNFPNSGDAYYRRLLESDPGNPLILRNYAQYLAKEGDLKKAEEFYERAILADPNDGDLLSNYAKLQWDANRDQDRAETYYGQAVKAAPEDCYVMASYASFLWDVEENEESIPAAAPSSGYGLQAPTPALIASG